MGEWGRRGSMASPFLLAERSEVENVMAKKSRQKHVPVRTCVGCRESRPKRDLVRVVRLADDGIVVDETGKRNGRGAYLCRRRPCWQRALDRGALGRALRVRLTSEDVAELRAYAESLPDAERSPTESSMEEMKE